MGKFAYTAVVVHGGFDIGKAEEGTAGYTPCPQERPDGGFPSYEAAAAHARALNVASGVNQMDAFRIVLGTMRGGLEAR